MNVDVDKFGTNCQRNGLDSKMINLIRVFPDSENYCILGIHNQRVFETDHSTTEFLNCRYMNRKLCKKFEIRIV